VSITSEDLFRGREAFEAREPRDAMYRVATYLIHQIADLRLGVLLSHRLEGIQHDG
jgi:hypothetical protein